VLLDEDDELLGEDEELERELELDVLVALVCGGQDSETLATPGGRLSEEIGAPGASW
jgi:hypothetical protein